MKANYLKIAMAVAMLFAANMNANAQFGKLKVSQTRRRIPRRKWRRLRTSRQMPSQKPPRQQ